MTPFYDEDGITIYHGDCREVIDTIAADVVITDPPYGVDLVARTTKRARRPGTYSASAFEDTPEHIRDVIVPTVERLTARYRRCVVTPGVRCMWMYPPPDDVGVIWSPAGAGMSRWGFNCSHPILYYGRDPYLARSLGSRPNGYAWNNATEENGHPCPKPLPVMLWLVARASVEGETVFDPFMGSGTTLVAAKRHGRRAVGVELSERYCEIAARRLAQGVLFGAAS